MKNATALLLALIFGISNIIGQVSEKPNFIFIVIDDLNDYVGYLEERTGTSTPAMDLLSSRGVSFVNAYANSPLCAPSRTSFLTGKSPEYTGILENDDYTDLLNLGNGKFRGLFDSTSQIITIPEYLKDSAGYYTYGLGKVFNGWYSITNNDNDFDSLTADPCERGLSWNAFADWPTSPTAVPVDSPAPYYQGITTFRFSDMPDSLEGEMEDTKMMNSAVAFLDQYAANPGDFCDRPFFLSVGIHKPHAPRYVPERYFSDFYKPDLYEFPYDLPYNVPANAWPPNGDQEIPRGEPRNSDFDALGPFGQLFAIGVGGELIFDSFPYLIDSLPQFSAGLDFASRAERYTRSKQALYTMAYEASVAYLDQQISRLINKLEDHPALYNNTVIVLVSDHGHTLGQKKHWRKGCLWDTDLHIPMIIVDPRRSIAGSLNYTPVSLLDLFPTFCEMAGLPEPSMPDGTNYFDGSSLVPMLDEPSVNWNRSVASFVSLPTALPYCRDPFYSVHDSEFHYIRYEYSFNSDCSDKTLEEELYHVGAQRNVDPYELNNLITDPAYQLVVNYLSSHLPDSNANLAYSAPLPGLQINTGLLPCNLNSTDTIQLSIEWLNEQGAVVPSGPGSDFEVNWYLNGQLIFTNDTTINIQAETDDQGRAIVELVLSDSAGRIFALDRVELLLDSTQPQPEFYIDEIDSSAVTLVSSYIPPNTFEQLWDWGDLTLLSGAQPAPHSYVAPGTYTISREITSNQKNYAHCVWSHDTTVTIDSASFRPICRAPLPPLIPDASADRFMVRWTPVYLADSYNLRFKKWGRKFTNYNSGNTTDTSITAGPLIPGKKWEVSVQAVCGTTTSEWSWPTTFENPTCLPPSKPGLTALTIDSVAFSWGTSPDATLGYDILLRQNGAPNRIFVSPENTSDFAIGGLQPSTTYRLFMRSRCHQVPPALYEPSNHVSTVFNSPAAVGLRNSQLKLWPNPARSTVTISAIPEVIGQRHIELIDGYGKLLRLEAIPADQAWHILSLDDLPAGLYTIRIALKDGKSIASAKLTVL